MRVFFPINFLILVINCLNNGRRSLLARGVRVAAVVATIVIAKVVVAVFTAGRYFSAKFVGSY